MNRAAACLVVLLLAGTPTQGAELFYMDHDPLTDEYVGPVGPLVLSGEIVPGDYDRLLAKIAEDENRFMAQNKIILGVNDGEVAEVIKIATLVKALFTEVIVGPLTGRCEGACFLIYAAAAQRGTDGPRLIGIHRPHVLEPQSSLAPGSDAAALDEQAQSQARAFLQANDVPNDLIELMFRHGPEDVYWLSEGDEQSLGAKSPSFERFLAEKCQWNDTLEQAVYKGEKPLEDLKEMWACRNRVTQPVAQKALALALKEKSTRDASGKPVDTKSTDTKPTDKRKSKPNGKPHPPNDKTTGAAPCRKKDTTDPNTDECAGNGSSRE